MTDSLIKQEFFLWLSKLNKDDISSNEIRIINLLIDYLDEIIPLGTARGARAKKIGYLIENNCTKLSSSLPNFDVRDIKNIVKPVSISELTIGPFRGFSSEEIFSFDKNYTFMYGPNGSGKTSFCEGLEYALLGRIDEADSRRIDINEYIKNVVVGRSKKPILKGLNETKQQFEIPENSNAYRFCFIERSRIDGFSRIAANPPKAQQDRISTLFGLDTFNTFVSNFPDTIDEKYLTRTNHVKLGYESEIATIEASNKRKITIKESYDEISQEVDRLLSRVKLENVDSLEKLKIYLNGEDGTKGRINELYILISAVIPSDLDEGTVSKVKEIVQEIKSQVGLISSKVTELRKSSSALDFKDLYTTLLNMYNNSEIDKTICPACKTSIENVVINPFSNATTELDKMEVLATLQDSIGKLKIDILKKLRYVNKLITELNEYKIKLDDIYNTFMIYDESKISEKSQIDEWIEFFELAYKQLEEDINHNASLNQKIVEYNAQLSIRRENQKGMDDELKRCIDYNKECLRITVSIDSLREEEARIEKFITDFMSNNDELIKEIEAIDERMKMHSDLVDSYESVIRKLKSYIISLPSVMSEGLSEKAREFYNIINSHDQDFERLEYLNIPSSPGENITVRFIGDKKEHNALLLLSEGHVRILGLAILLAKVVRDDLSFIVYDDIVNAIDDEHRDGISELIINNADMKKRQHILTCHGDLFINKLEHKLGLSKVNSDVKRYRFNPSDSFCERGVKVSVGDTKHYIALARKHYVEDARKDAAFKCRQALESISEQLWKKLGDRLNILLTVKMKTPAAKPDLSTVVDSLIKEFAKLDETSAICEDLRLIKDKYNWTILNKGTHEQGDLPEFNRKDLLDCIETLERIESNTRGLKFAFSLV